MEYMSRDHHTLPLPQLDGCLRPLWPGGSQQQQSYIGSVCAAVGG